MIEIALIGAGFMGQNHARTIAERHGLTLKYVVDIDVDQAQRVASTYGATAGSDHESAIADVDAVVIASPPPVHFDQAEVAIDANRHLLLEKPIALTVEDAQTLASKASSTDAITSTGFILRHTPEYAQVREQVTSDAFGDLAAARAKRAITTNPDSDGNAQLHGHPVIYMNVHDIDAFRFCLDAEVEAVTAQQHSGMFPDMEIPDAVQALLTFDNDAIGVLEGSGLLPERYPEEISASFEVTGSQGTASISFPGNGLSSYAEDYERFDSSLWPTVNDRMGGAIRTQMDQFESAIRNDGTPAASMKDGYRALVVAEAIVSSIESGQTESVSY